MSFQFAWPWLLLALPLPLLSLQLLPRVAAEPAAALRVPFLPLLGASGLLYGAARPARWRRVLALIAWTALVVAAARPQLLGDALQLPVTGRSLMLAVDISGSMINEDMRLQDRQVARVTAVKALASDFLRRRSGDRVGLILFGREAYLQAPLTLDRQTVATLLGEAQVGLAGKETAIGDAIGLAVKRLRDQPEQNRVLLLLTDGANTAGAVDPLKAADLAAQERVRIYTIGIGARRGFADEGVDELGLTRLAEVTGGRHFDELHALLVRVFIDAGIPAHLIDVKKRPVAGYFRARDTAELAQVYETLDAIEPASEDNLIFRPADEIYVWPLALALLLSVLSALPAVWRWHPAVLTHGEGRDG